MSEFSFAISGDREVLRMLEALPERAQKQILDPIMRTAAQQLTGTLKSRAPRETGLLAQAIGATPVKRYGTALFLTVGARRGFKRAVTPKVGRPQLRGKKFTEQHPDSAMRDPTRYLHLVSGGRKAVAVREAKVLFSAASGRFFGKAVREAKAAPFVTEVFESEKAAVASLITKRAEAAIVAEAAKLANGGG